MSRLPSGRETNSDKVYIREWRRLGNAMGRLFGMRCYAFDPDIALMDKDGHRSFFIPGWAALRLLKNMPH